MKKYLGLLLLFSLLSSSLLAQVPDGYLLVPIPTMKSWGDRLEAISASLSLTEKALLTSQNSVGSLRLDVSSLMSEVEDWKERYQILLNDSDTWTGDYTTLNLELEKLEKEFNQITKQYADLLPKLEKALKQLKVYKIATYSLAGALILTIVLMVVLK